MKQPACLVAATALPVAFGGVALHEPCPVGFCGSCFQHVPVGAVMLSAAMLAAIAFLCMGFSSMTTVKLAQGSLAWSFVEAC